MDLPHQANVMPLSLKRRLAGHDSPKTASDILAEALAGDAHVDFPMVTEICERTRCDALELATLTCLLASVLGDCSLGEDLSRQLKAVTVAHELLYDESARKALAAAPGLLDSLEYLKVAASAIGATSPAAEGIHLLASETLRQLTPPASPCGLKEDRGWFGVFEDFLADITIA